MSELSPLQNDSTKHTPFFPVTHSLLSTSALVSEVLTDYNIGQLIACRLIAHNLNDTYLVITNAEKYILRVYQAPRTIGWAWRSASDILYEIDLLLHLGRKGISVSTPLVRKDGTFIRTLQTPEGPRHVVLFTYAEGESLTFGNLNATVSSLYGRDLADIHTTTDDFTSAHSRFHLDLEFLLDKSLQCIQPVIAHRPDDWAYLLQLTHQLKEHIATLPAGELDTGPCHGDLQGGNANLAGEHKLTFFDFDVCGFGWRAYDLAVFCWAAALGKTRLGRKDEDIEILWTSFLNGYQERRKLRPINIQAIPLFVAVRHIWFLGLHTGNWDNWGYGEVNDHFFDREMAFLRDWVTQRIGAGENTLASLPSLGSL
ncbi:phosphotransferase [Dictyobacter arantiisoli]|uniref:Aminoglycoside phosphotransferase domain-containing protein n=1 Tax=Dictyobacter arantiisoli TaxID=2014874 RepID=A0A5A5TFW8_9CHLR|nr:phosphotransferase [Dictyobacter arantiisoli]GCF10046.1 hypothetical protein KDI_36100 [Dictyobacter arantiisoli]